MYTPDPAMYVCDIRVSTSDKGVRHRGVLWEPGSQLAWDRCAAQWQTLKKTLPQTRKKVGSEAAF